MSTAPAWTCCKCEHTSIVRQRKRGEKLTCQQPRQQDPNTVCGHERCTRGCALAIVRRPVPKSSTTSSSAAKGRKRDGGGTKAKKRSRGGGAGVQQNSPAKMRSTEKSKKDGDKRSEKVGKAKVGAKN